MRALVTMALIASGLLGQAASSVPAFAVASVKAADPHSRTGSDFRLLPGGTLRVTQLNLGILIREAFGVKHYQVSGAPGWLGTDEFDILAKAEGNPSRTEMMLMLQRLLAERFHLKVHRESREANVYTLVVAKNGPKLQASTGDEHYMRLNRNTPPELPGVSYTIVAKRASLAQIAERLGETLDRPVLDQTGIAGEFDFRLEYGVGDSPDAGPSMFRSVQDQLGLRLQAGRGSIEMLVIDHVEKLSDDQ